MANKFDRKNPVSKCSTLMGSKVMHVSAGVNHRSNFLAFLRQGLANLKGITPDQCITLLRLKVMWG